MSSKKQITTRIKSIEGQRHQLIEELLSAQQMVRGSFTKGYRKCGKPNCWCVEGKGHPINRIVWTEMAKARAKSIPQEDCEWAKVVTEHYKRFRKVRKKIRGQEKRLNQLLDELEKKVVNDTKKCRPYFD